MQTATQDFTIREFADRAPGARLASLVAFFVNGSVFGVWATQIPAIKDHLDLSPGVLGVALLCLAAGALTAMVGTGPLLGRVGSAPVIRLTAVAFALILPLPALMPDLLSLCAVLFLFGAAGGTMDVAMNAHGALVERHLGRPIMSSLHGMWSLGGLFGAGVGGLLLQVLPPPVQASILAAALLALFFALHRRFLPGSADQQAEPTGLALPDRGTLLLGALTFLAFMSEGAILDWSAVYLREDLGGAASIAALGFAVFSGAMAVGRFCGDRLRQRFGGPVLVRAGAVLAFAGLAVALTGGGPVVAVAGFGLTGLGLSNVVPVLFSAAGAKAEGEAGQAIAAVATLGYAGVLTGPALLGFVAEASTVGFSFALVAALALVIAAASSRAVAQQG
ncbi:MFS transporter (plasmid) [Azospirillum baldaniorum]|uniref:Permease of the major facilitator superfamily MFS-1 n=1 Tax=Azospirillum baldaniorum TaxID=1064539 RepID=A0A9P1NP84_9PROT|nr:MFS transporter [Azospirillum baldaniorum]AWJ92103.1 MFS transporter [Azospirillum baldaniorum]TWA73639.1 putative MFS family arabinose efflux permease [Azospirillum brasilense]CCD00574.1 putative permease of the major facilitator superfamily MFS-1 [Azospirillum baldaniorum]